MKVTFTGPGTRDKDLFCCYRDKCSPRKAHALLCTHLAKIEALTLCALVSMERGQREREILGM